MHESLNVNMWGTGCTWPAVYNIQCTVSWHVVLSLEENRSPEYCSAHCRHVCSSLDICSHSTCGLQYLELKKRETWAKIMLIFQGLFLEVLRWTSSHTGFYVKMSVYLRTLTEQVLGRKTKKKEEIEQEERPRLLLTKWEFLRQDVGQMSSVLAFTKASNKVVKPVPV